MINRTFATFLFVAMTIGTLFSQNTNWVEGDVLPFFLGKTYGSEEVKDLKAKYRFEMASEKQYISKEGIEIVFRKEALSEIHLYSGSAVYGNYASRLPNGLKFGMYTSDVKKLLGKPALNYNNGYWEYELKSHIVSCWFDFGQLTQVGISAKDAY